MKKRSRSKLKPKKSKDRRRKIRATRPREVYVAIRKLLDTTNHIQARAAEVENSLDRLREQERTRAVKELLVALRNSPDGDLLRFHPGGQDEGSDSTAKAISAALSEAFSIVPIRSIGEEILVKNGEIPDTLELDRSIGEETEKCVAAEVVSVGWSYKSQALLKPVVRPVFSRKQPSGEA
jgi:hypothetical protein